jgi:4-aminobutyrate aminotransferase-like enzyme
MEKENLPARATETGNYAMTNSARPEKAPPTHRRRPRPGPDDRQRAGKRRKANSSRHRSRSHPRRPAAQLVGIGGIYGNVIRFQPPLTRQQIDQAMDAFAAALQEVRQPTVV